VLSTVGTHRGAILFHPDEFSGKADWFGRCCCNFFVLVMLTIRTHTLTYPGKPAGNGPGAKFSMRSSTYSRLGQIFMDFYFRFL
jgi:hypothetical protein